MRRSLPLAAFFVAIGIASALAQPSGSKTPEFRLPITYQDQQITQHVAVGYDPQATVGRDTAFGEEVYPNFGGPGGGAMFLDYPGVLDYGTRVDIRPKPTTDSFYIQYDLHVYGSIYPGKLSWDTAYIPQMVSGMTITPKGDPSKILVDMKHATSADVVLDNFAYHDWENAVITLFYNMTPRVLGVKSSPHYAGLISNLTAYPNPFTSQSTLTFDLADPSAIDVRAFDLTGREVGRLTQAAVGRSDLELLQLIPDRGAYFLRIQATSSRGADERTILVRRQ